MTDRKETIENKAVRLDLVYFPDDFQRFLYERLRRPELRDHKHLYDLHRKSPD